MARKLGLCFKSVNLYATLAFSLFSAACIHPPKTVQNITASDWPSVLGGPARTPFLQERAPADPKQQWQERYGRGFTDVPFVADNILIAASTAKTVSVANATTGRRFWERRLNGVIVGAVLRYNERLYAATQSRDGHVDALNLDRGRHAWNFKLHAPAAGGAIIVDSTMYVGNDRAELFALNIAHGQLQWRVRIPSPPATTPVAFDKLLVIAMRNDSLVTVERYNGAVHAGLHLSGANSAPMTRVGDRILVPMQPGLLQAVRLPDLHVEWTADLGAPILASPAIDTNGDIYTLTRSADVFRVSANGTATRIARLGGVATGSLTLTADGLIIGKLDGSVHLLRRDGTEVWQRSFPHAVRTPVAVRGGALFVPLGDGHLVMMR